MMWLIRRSYRVEGVTWHSRRDPHFLYAHDDNSLTNKIGTKIELNFGFQVAFCATFGMIGNPELDYMSWALNWGVAYDLPNQTWIIEHRRQKVMPKPIAQRRHRRDLYNRLETAIDKSVKFFEIHVTFYFTFYFLYLFVTLISMGYNGRECVLRALCESAQFLYKEGTNMVEELVRIIF